MVNSRPSRLKELVLEQEKREAEERTKKEEKKDRTVSRIVTDSTSKSKQISAKVNESVYDAFSKINRLQGVSNNSAINMIIARYVRENKDILDEE